MIKWIKFLLPVAHKAYGKIFKYLVKLSIRWCLSLNIYMSWTIFLMNGPPVPNAKKEKAMFFLVVKYLSFVVYFILKVTVFDNL